MLLHYFLTSLPPLSLDRAPGITVKDFLRRAHDSLGEAIHDDLKLLIHLRHGAKAGGLRQGYWPWLKETCRSSFIQQWADCAVEIYQTLAQVLKEDHGLTAAGTKGAPLYHVFNHALAEKNPNVLEDAVDKALINAALQCVTSDDAFSEQQVFVYFITLVLAERRASFSTAKGQTILHAFVDTAIKGAHYERA